MKQNQRCDCESTLTEDELTEDELRFPTATGILMGGLIIIKNLVRSAEVTAHYLSDDDVALNRHYAITLTDVLELIDKHMNQVEDLLDLTQAATIEDHHE